MLTKLLDLAAHPDTDSRRDLLRSIADMFYREDRDRAAESEVRLFAEVATRVLTDLAETDRVEFSSRVAGNDRTPRQVAMALASDTAAVAAPIIEQSTSLTDDDLIRIASTQTIGHRLAISRRANVPVRVTDVLVDHGETEVMHSLLDNKTAQTSTAALEKVAARAEEVVELREKLCGRKDVPETVLRRLLPLLEPEARARAEAMLEQEGEGVAELVLTAQQAVVVGRGSTARRRLEIKGLAARLTRHEFALEPYLANLTASRRATDLAFGLSLITDLPEKQVANAVVAATPEPLAIICKSLQITRESYRVIESIRRESIRTSTEVAEEVLEQYAKLDLATAQRALRFVRVRSTAA